MVCSIFSPLPPLGEHGPSKPPRPWFGARWKLPGAHWRWPANFPLGERLVALLVCAVVGLAVYNGLTRDYEGDAWPTVSAVVVESRMVSRRERLRSSTTDSPSPFSENATITTYDAQVMFQYTLYGTEYLSTNGTGRFWRNHAVPRETVARYAPGTIHTIRVNPEKPLHVLFETPSDSDVHWIETTIALAFLAFVLWSVVWKPLASGWKAARPVPSPPRPPDPIDDRFRPRV